MYTHTHFKQWYKIIIFHLNTTQFSCQTHQSPNEHEKITSAITAKQTPDKTIKINLNDVFIFFIICYLVQFQRSFLCFLWVDGVIYYIDIILLYFFRRHLCCLWNVKKCYSDGKIIFRMIPIEKKRPISFQYS